MKVEELIIYGKKYIHSTDVKMLLATVLECDYLELLTRLNEVVDSDKIDEFKRLINLRKDIPIEYITNEARFYYMDLYVNENVLIPRFETEELVENTLKFLKECFDKPKILDLCCGSGAIGLALKNNIKDSIVHLSDISNEALDVASINKERLNLDVKIIQSDLFSNITDRYDLIISNPPYIRDDEKIEDSVYNNEPHLALFAGSDGLYFYDKILSTIEKHLNDKYMIAFEIGCNQKEEVIKLINKYLKDVNIITKKDMQGRDRMIFIIKESGELC